MSERMAIIGTGNVGGNLGQRLSEAGYEVRFGVREGKDVGALLEQCGGRASATEVQAAAGWADVVFLAVPAAAALPAAQSLGNVAGKVVVDCTNPLRWDAGPVWTPPPEGSAAAAIAAVLPGASVLKAFNTFGAEIHLDPAVGGLRADLYMAGDDADAKRVLSAVGERAGFDPVDCGPLRNAALLENLAILWIHLALVGGKSRNMAFKLVSR